MAVDGVEGRWTIHVAGYREDRIEGEYPPEEPMPVVPCDGAAVERAARAGWDYAESRERVIAEEAGRRYVPVSWGDAHPLDHDEYRAYVRVVLAAAGGG